MATRMNLRNKNFTRPKKKPRARRLREKAQRKRLIRLGMPAEQAERLNAAELRAALREYARRK